MMIRFTAIMNPKNTDTVSYTHLYLDAIIQYRSLSANRTTSVSQDTLLAFYRTLAKHPKIEFDIDNKGPVSISDYTALLDSMTLEDAKGLRDGTVSHLSISCLLYTSKVFCHIVRDAEGGKASSCHKELLADSHNVYQLGG